MLIGDDLSFEFFLLLFGIAGSASTAATATAYCLRFDCLADVDNVRDISADRRPGYSRVQKINLQLDDFKLVHIPGWPDFHHCGIVQPKRLISVPEPIKITDNAVNRDLRGAVLLQGLPGLFQEDLRVFDFGVLVEPVSRATITTVYGIRIRI